MYNKRFCCENSRLDNWLLSSNIENSSCIPTISRISKFTMYNAGVNYYKSDSSSTESVDTAKYVLLNMQKKQIRKKTRNHRNLSIKDRSTTQKNVQPQFKKSKSNSQNGIQRSDYLEMYKANLNKQNKNISKQLKGKRDQHQIIEKKITEPIDVYTPRRKLSIKNRNITINRDELIDIIGTAATNHVLQSSKTLTFSENSKIIYIPPEKDADFSESDDDILLKIKHNGFLRSVKG